MAKAASKYISFDTAGNFVSEFEDGSAAPEAPEDGSLKSAVSYALDAIVEAAGTLPDTAAALVGARPGAAHRDPEEKVADVSEHVRSTIGDDFAVSAAAGAKPRALVIASAKNARAFVVPMEQAGLDVVFATVDNRSLDGFARRMLPTYNLGSTTADVDADTLSANIYTVLSAAKACGATLIFLDSAKASLAEDAYFLRHAAKRGLRVFAPATEGTLRTGWVELLPAGVAPALGAASPSEAPWENEPARVADDDEGPTHWRRCHKCKLFFDKEEIIELGGYCPACGTLQRLRSDERLAATVDAGSFEEWNAVMPDSNPLDFPGYPEKIADQREKSGLEEAVRTGRATIAGLPLAVGVMESGFFMGSMGHVVGEKVAAMIDRAIAERLPVVAQHLHEHAPVGQLRGQLHRLGDAARGALLQLHAVHHHVDEVLDLLVKRTRLAIQLNYLAINANTAEALMSQICEQLGEFSLTTSNHRRHDDGLRAGIQGQDVIGHLIGGLLLDNATAFRAMGNANASVQQAKIIIYFSGSAHR